MTQPTLVEYGVARVLRLFPALIIVCVALAFVLGPAVSLLFAARLFRRSEALALCPAHGKPLYPHADIARRVRHGAGSRHRQFAALDAGYEAFCYLLLAVFAMAALFRTRTRTGAALAAIFALYALVTLATDWRDQSSALDSTMRFLLDFFLGAALYAFADRIRLSLGVLSALAAVSLLVYATPLGEACARIALAYAVIWLALVPKGSIRAFNRAGDYSYGIYITCFPVQQTLVMLDPTLGPGALLAMSLPAVLGLAMLSWHCIEHPALRQKVWLGGKLAALIEGARLKRGIGLPSRA